MVHREHDDVLVGCETQQAHPQQWADAQIEGTLHLLHHPLRGHRLTLRRRLPAEVFDLQAQRVRRMDDLHGLFLDHAEGGAQGFVTTHDLAQTPLQRRDVEGTGDAQDDGNVVHGGTGHELFEEPQTLLCKGERSRRRLPRRVVTSHRHDGRQASLGRRLQGFGDACGERFEHGSLEESAQREFDVERIADAGDQLRRQQRMSTEGEEVVRHADPLDGEQLLPHAAQQLLHRRARRDIFRSILAPHALRRGQRFSVHLAVRRQRHLIEHAPPPTEPCTPAAPPAHARAVVRG